MQVCEHVYILYVCVPIHICWLLCHCKHVCGFVRFSVTNFTLPFSTVCKYSFLYLLCVCVCLYVCVYVCVCVYYSGIWRFEALKIWINEKLWLLEQKCLPGVRTPPASEPIQLSLLASHSQRRPNTSKPGNTQPQHISMGSKGWTRVEGWRRMDRWKEGGGVHLWREGNIPPERWIH